QQVPPLDQGGHRDPETAFDKTELLTTHPAFDNCLHSSQFFIVIVLKPCLPFIWLVTESQFIKNCSLTPCILYIHALKILMF
uniref:Uncharacterized protein n=1 Tax=Salarias fasciatus TaxID=181472 RepID=A0A672HZJ1_SALFA